MTHRISTKREDEAKHIKSHAKPDPVTQLQQLHSSGGGLSAKVANAYLTTVRADRKQWRKCGTISTATA